MTTTNPIWVTAEEVHAGGWRMDAEVHE